MRRLVHRPWVCGPVCATIRVSSSTRSSFWRGHWHFNLLELWWKMISWRWSWLVVLMTICDQTMSTCVATLSNGFGRGMEGHLNLQTRSGQSFTRLLCVTFLHDTWRSYLRNCIVLYRVFPRMVISFPTNIIRAKRSSLQCRVQCKSSDSEPLSLHSYCQ